MKLNFNFSGKTLMRDWWKIVKDNFTDVQEEFNSHVSDFESAVETLQNNINNESSGRKSADSSLQSSVSFEASARQSADSALQNNINVESEERKNADINLGSRVDAEMSNRINADDILRQSISSEISARQSADNAFSQSVGEIRSWLDILREVMHSHANKDVLDAITEDDVENWNGIKEQVTQTQLDAAIAAEAAARESADDALRKSIGEESQNRSEADAELANAHRLHEEYANDIFFGLLNEMQLLYALLSVTVYDGGLFEMEQDGAELDGGLFSDTELESFDCGGFEPLTLTAAVIDGGNY